jgi:hypothetical protein
MKFDAQKAASGVCLVAGLVLHAACTPSDDSALFEPTATSDSDPLVPLGDDCERSSTGIDAGGGATPEQDSGGPLSKVDGAVADRAHCVARPVCAAGQFRCEGSLLQSCNEEGNGWLDIDRCASAELCDASRRTGGCLPQTCEAGALRCAGDTLERCRDGGDNSDPVAECALAGGCDPIALACRDACIVGGARCRGAALEICDDVLTGWQSTVCASPELCNAEARRCEPPRCEPDEPTCQGSQPQRCAPGRDGFVDVGAPCASVELCDPSRGACVEPACAAGETACGGLMTLLTCNASQTGFDTRACGLLALCDSGPPALCRPLL